MKNNMLKIGITGGMGSGKSYVCRILHEMGFPVFDCDTEAKRIMETSPLVIAGLKRLVGEQVYTEEGKINKPVMSAFLFADAEHAEAVSSVVHPAVGQGFSEFVDTNKNAKACVMESAILIESGLTPLVDKMVCVTAPLELRVRRVQLRDGLDEENIRKRIARQMLEDERMKYPFDYRIENDGLTNVKEQVGNMLKEFKLF